MDPHGHHVGHDVHVLPPSAEEDLYDTANAVTDIEAQRVPSHIDGFFQVRGSHVSGSHGHSRRSMGGSRVNSQHSPRRGSRQRENHLHGSRERRYLYDEIDDDRHRSIRRNDDAFDRRGSYSRSRSMNRVRSSQRRPSPATSVHSDETSPRVRNFNSNRSVGAQRRSRSRMSLEYRRDPRRRSPPDELWRVVESRSPRDRSHRRSSRHRMTYDNDPEDVYRVVTPSPRSGYSPRRPSRRR